MSKLTYQERKRMRPSSFALERQRKYPLDTVGRAKNALARVSAHGNADEKYEVRREVFAKYPQLKGGKAWEQFQLQKKRRGK